MVTSYDRSIPNDEEVSIVDVYPGADLSAVNLIGANLPGVSLSDADLSGANLTGAKLFDIYAPNAGLSGDLSDIHFLDANFHDADLSGASLVSTDLRFANLSKATLSDADLTGANLWGADLRDADLSGADLLDTVLWNANVSRIDLSDADLSLYSSNGLSGRDLSDTNFSGANLTRVNLSDADLSGADLSNANLHQADLSGADLNNADLSDTDLTGADLSGTHLIETDFSGAVLSRQTSIADPKKRVKEDNPKLDERNYDRIARANHALRTTYSANGLISRARTARIRERIARRVEARVEGGVGWLEWFWSILSHVSTGYGIQIRWTLAAIVSLFLSSTIVYLTLGDMAGFESVYYSVVTFTTSPPADPVLTSDIARAVAALETFAGTALIIFLGYVLSTRERV